VLSGYSVDYAEKLSIRGYPRKICGYGHGYGWEISYPRQVCLWSFTSGQSKRFAMEQTYKTIISPLLTYVCQWRLACDRSRHIWQRTSSDIDHVW